MSCDKIFKKFMRIGKVLCEIDIENISNKKRLPVWAENQEIICQVTQVTHTSFTPWMIWLGKMFIEDKDSVVGREELVKHTDNERLYQDQQKANINLTIEESLVAKMIKNDKLLKLYAERSQRVELDMFIERSKKRIAKTLEEIEVIKERTLKEREAYERNLSESTYITYT